MWLVEFFKYINSGIITFLGTLLFCTFIIGLNTISIAFLIYIFNAYKIEKTEDNYVPLTDIVNSFKKKKKINKKPIIH